MESKKYSEMTFEEFITEVLGFRPNEQQLHMLRMFEETKIKKVEYMNGSLPVFRDTINLPSYPNSPIFTKEDSATVRKPNGAITY
jgi:hypothetical protein